jgi:alkaline phosphatase D
MVGSVTQTSARVWICYKGKGKNAVILGDTAAKKVVYPTNYNYKVSKKGIISLTFDFTGLEPNHTYNVLASIEGLKTNTKCSFTTQSNDVVKDFNFILGSCAMMNTDWTRFGLPGASTTIFNKMRKQKSDFMVWLGDDLYYYGKQLKNTENMFVRNVKVRSSFKYYRNFISSTPQYAIWDDHDYGPNDSDKKWALKDSSLALFKSFWPNTYPEQPQFNGNYFNFRYYDAEFFMMDDRFFRDEPKEVKDPDFLGETQLVWLKNKLQLSDATFKFIAIGTQILNQNHFGESYADYPKERQDLLDFISKNNIKGVVFLTGDKHYSEICKSYFNYYPIYDFTCSPLTTPPLPRKLLGAYKNADRIPGTDFAKRNFGKIKISGEKGNRICTIQIYGRGGHKRREFAIPQSELSQKLTP